MLLALIRGALLGLLTCLTFGPVTVAVMRAGFQRRVSAALICGAGAALVDAVESQLAYLGVAELVRGQPGAIPALYLLAGTFLIVGAVMAARSGPQSSSGQSLASGARAFAQGVVMTAVNPAPLLGWIALAGSLFAYLGPREALVASLGVGAGVFFWFVAVTVLAVRGSSLLGARTRVVTRILDFILAGAGVYLLLRGAMGVLGG